MPHVATRTTTSPTRGSVGSGTSSIRRSRAAWKRRARIALRDDPLRAQAREEVEKRRLGVADAEEAELPAAAHVGERLDRSAEVGVGVPPRRKRVHAEVAEAV